MPELQWDEQELLECIAVIPEVEEYETEHVYRLSSAGVTLTVTLWKWESTVEIALALSDNKQPLTKLTFLVRGRVQCRQENERTCLVFPNAALVPSRFYLAHEWNFAEDTHPGVDVTVQIHPEISLSLNEALRHG